MNTAGPNQHELEHGRAYAGVLPKLWSAATHFALVRHGRAPVDAADVVTPTPELLSLKSDLAPLRERIVEAKWVKEWPGTQSGGASILWIKGRAGGTAPFPLNDELLWRGFGDWDDLQLFAGDALTLFVCSHERFGSVFGSPAELQRLGLPVSKRDLWPHQVVGSPMSSAVLKALLEAC